MRRSCGLNFAPLGTWCDVIDKDSNPRDHVGEAGTGSKPCLREGRKAHFKAGASRGKRMGYLEPEKVEE